MGYRTKNTAVYTAPSKNTATYTDKSKTVLHQYLLLESGGFLLNETGGKIILDDGTINPTYSSRTKNN